MKPSEPATQSDVVTVATAIVILVFAFYLLTLYAVWKSTSNIERQINSACVPAVTK